VVIVIAAGLLRLPRVSPASRAIGTAIASGIAALIFGVGLPHSPRDTIALLVLLPLGCAAPTVSVLVLLAITVLVPWDVQSHFQILGGHGHRGVLFIDALLLVALARSGWQIIRRRTQFDSPMMWGTIVAAILAAATLWGVAQGADVSAAGNEGRRVLFGASTFLLVWPLLRDPLARKLIARWLPIIGLALGFWGLAQWLFDVPYSSAGDVGVRGGLSSGQLQGGLYAYPVAVTLSWAALIAGRVKRTGVKALLGSVLAVNTVCLFLTFERTLMVSTALACCFVAAIGGAEARRHAVRWGAVLLLLVAVGVALGAAQARTAFERMALLGNVDSDNSYTHRMIEADVISAQIAAHPIIGSGLGAAVTWGVQDKFATNTTPFADLGYHWLAWKIGLPAAVAITMLLLRAIFRGTPGIDERDWHALRIGCRGSLLALSLISVMFGVFNALGITAVIGLLLAICYSDQTGIGAVPDSSQWSVPHPEETRCADEAGIEQVTKTMEGVG
jgi:hypothetical protein